MIKEIQKERIIEVYINSNLSLDLAAVELGCSVGTLRKWMKIYNIKSKGKVRFGIKKGARFAILGDIEWLKKQLETKSFRDIALEVGTTEGNISDRVKRYGLRPKNWSHSSFSKQGLKKKYPGGRYGDKSSNWKGGVTTLYNLIRESIRNKNWMKDCLFRDNFTCRFCGKKGGDLEIHHKKSLSSIIYENKITSFEKALTCELLWDINNGETLCPDCHKKTESYGRQKK